MYRRLPGVSGRRAALAAVLANLASFAMGVLYVLTYAV